MAMSNQTGKQSQLKPNKKFDHVFAIIRVDSFQGPEVPIEQKVTVKKVMWGADEAKKEVVRLNKAHKHSPGVSYVLQVSRLEKQPAALPTSDATLRTALCERNELIALLNEYADHAEDSGWGNLAGEIRRRVEEIEERNRVDR